MLSHYYTVKSEGEHEIIIQKSRFIGSCRRVESAEEAIDFIQQKKKQHAAATHNCSAYLIGENDLIQKANDDGEPSGTAGVPMLEVLKKQQLKDTVVVVTRYFGGIKLGAGGLIRAYGKAVSEALLHTGVVKRTLMTIVQTDIEYSLLGKVENEVRQSPYPLKQMDYLENVRIQLYVEQDAFPQFQEWMTELTNGQGQISVIGSEYLEEDA
ncbi:YigZ family protein [Aureibacillus halotolerans]|uniref:Putative YigZ family protein n=1 Tax=Aureibacillus halotolerans TaxID=1508390 RepID=A0A4R6TTC8_9BACI|nr:YigZ family protein [Aureibacillus halotolerans]TDQ36920.1 putative YigZ family protein [Aureibacillus halotolerans]